jgi:multiple sugar transport system substrate-binding protein
MFQHDRGVTQVHAAASDGTRRSVTPEEDKNMNANPRRTPRRRAVLASLMTGSALAVTGCSGGVGEQGTQANGGGGAGSSDEVPIVSVWAWYPQFDKVVEKFNETHDDVQIEWTNAGVSEDVYAKLRTALEAGSGAPDVTQMEYSELPAFQVTGSLADIGQYGANEVKDDYPEWVWGQVSDGDSVYAIPVDAGPIVMFYREDLYEEYGLEVPTTWEEYREAAEKLQEQNPDLWISDFQVGNASNHLGLIQQAGGQPYGYSFTSAEDITLNFDSEQSRRVLNYWADMVADGLVDDAAYHSTEWDNKLSTGQYLTTIEAAWRPGYLGSVAEDTSGKWRVAPKPQWDEGDDAYGNHGGSSFAVTNQAADRELAARVAMELFGSEETWQIGIEEAFLFPTWQPIAESEWFLEKEYEFFGGQKINEVIVPVQNSITPLHFSPFDSRAKSFINEEIAAAIEGSQTMNQAVESIQAKLVAHARSLGMNVTAK